MLERSSDMITRHDPDGTFTYVSSACRTIYGRAPEELVGCHPLDFVHPDDVEVVTAAIARVRDGENRVRVEHRVPRPGGSFIWDTILDVDFERGIAVGSVRDVTAQRAAQQALEEAQSNVRAVIDVAAAALSRTTPDGRVLYASPGVQRVSGRSAHEVIGHNYREWAHPDDVERYDQAYERLRQGADTVELEYRFARPDGRYMWVHALLRSRRDRHGTLVEVVRVSRDITEHKEQGERLQELSEIFEDALVHAPIGMGLQHPDGTFFKVNRELCRITGYAEHELVGKSSVTSPPSTTSPRISPHTRAWWPVSSRPTSERSATCTPTGTRSTSQCHSARYGTRTAA